MEPTKNISLLSRELSLNNLSLNNISVKSDTTESVKSDNSNPSNLSESVANKKNCPICYDLINDKYDLDCCDADICQTCIDALIEPKCPFCRSIIKKIANDPKYRLSSSCPTTDHLTQDLIRQYQTSNRYSASDDINLTNRVRINNRRRIMSTLSEINAERRAQRIANGSITPYSRSRTNSEISNQIREGLDIYMDSLDNLDNRNNTDSASGSASENEIDSDDVFRLESFLDQNLKNK